MPTWTGVCPSATTTTRASTVFVLLMLFVLLFAVTTRAGARQHGLVFEQMPPQRPEPQLRQVSHPRHGRSLHQPRRGETIATLAVVFFFFFNPL